ncbi:MAG: 2Fe-2S iron-sulfur cluster-binding protein, partial [Desulfobacterales bacterium]|nr:2Fe-2S iron-sulfur cluster-binding protein [Desulfobacterales bacterium]MDX2509405.1 2Fe-2S iron-sulfur cluster-binding protein [Desulfobacterales bacterium]
MVERKSIVINGNELLFEAGETILDVARRNDIDIPTLCYLKGTIPHGACRICVVEVEGADKLMAACETPAGDNMIVETESPRVVEARRSIIQLML